MANIVISEIKLLNFNPKDITGDIEVNFSENDTPDVIVKNFVLKKPEQILNKILLDVKSKNKILFDDPTLSPVELLERYRPVIIYKEEETEEKIYNFIRNLCENSRKLKSTKEAVEHMRIFSGFKSAILKL